MGKRSFSTFVNAFTSKEWTGYPFSTINKTDFFNLLDVYLDACFHPLLEENNYLSECHRIEFEDNDPNKPLTYNGVVYNEMVGSFSEPRYYFQQVLSSNLYPNTCCRHCSGGKPSAIVKSTLEDLREHHKAYYHPSNALFYYYGNIDIDEVLSKVDSVISEINVRDVTFQKETFEQPKWDTPKKVVFEGPKDQLAQDPNKQYRAVVGWIGPDVSDIEKCDDFDFLSDLLTSSANSPLYKALIKTNIGTNYAGSGYSDAQKTTSFTIGVQGATEENAEKVCDIVMDTLKTVYEEGFDKERVDALIHTNEIESRVISAETGQTLWLNNLSQTLHGNSILNYLDLDKRINRFRQNIKDNPRYYEEFMKRELIDNNSRVFVIMKPIDNFFDSENERVKTELQTIKESLDEKQKQELVDQIKHMNEVISQHPNVDILPCITRSDLDEQCKYNELDSFEDNVAVLTVPLNGLVYLQFNFEIHFGHELISYLPILAHIIDLVGAANYNEEELPLFLKKYTSGINVHLNSDTSIDDPNASFGVITMTSYCLEKDYLKMLEAFKIIIESPHLDNVPRIKTLINKYYSYLTQSSLRRGDGLISKLLCSSLSNKAALDELWRGSTFIKLLSNIIKEDDWEGLSKKLQRIHKEIFRRSYCKAFIHATKVNSEILDPLKEMVNEMNKNENVERSQLIDRNIFSNNDKIFVQVQTSTSFTGSAFPIVCYSDPESSIYSILCLILKNEFLNQMIRVEIGAYGQYASYLSMSGIISLTSYRDSNPLLVLNAFKKALGLIADGKIDDEMVERAVIRRFSVLDTPLAPKEKGFTAYEGKTKEKVQKRRSACLNCTKEMIISLAKKIMEKNWKIGILSNDKICKPPEGFKVVRITE
ncbi:Clan ME, family M16, insulinase-like metallopeptidase [Histomonas meleagridis]|uniref:Clan ME, family M16, insulinase-like metallopeptidase n=1 Tax=Histomonas meleagridis TaxID=135588 RepID=UPI00355A86B6|nr:Clan ME, family M16, insulinase-like metallopeptidase [Histomonas meleagridis]KAH0806728.1 Clan ME, family M16, insulinase-like metallopeptidase [Histomonas meleagridis]